MPDPSPGGCCVGVERITAAVRCSSKLPKPARDSVPGSWALEGSSKGMAWDGTVASGCSGANGSALLNGDAVERAGDCIAGSGSAISNPGTEVAIGSMLPSGVAGCTGAAGKLSQFIGTGGEVLSFCIDVCLIAPGTATGKSARSGFERADSCKDSLLGGAWLKPSAIQKTKVPPTMVNSPIQKPKDLFFILQPDCCPDIFSDNEYLPKVHFGGSLMKIAFLYKSNFGNEIMLGKIF